MAASGVLNDDDVPPLEDMSEMLQTISELKKDTAKPQVKSRNPLLESSIPPENARLQSIEKLLGKDEEPPSFAAKTTAVTPSEDAHKKVHKSKTAAKVETGFAGFKKGFLLGNSKGSTVASKPCKEKKRIEEVQPSQQKENPLVFNEVQDALAAQMPLLQSKEWINDDLLSKLERNPKLLKKLGDPRYSQALDSFQTNPQEAMAALQNDPEVKEFIQEFCGILGDHFDTLGEKEKKVQASKASIEILEAASSRKLGSQSSKPLNSEEDERKLQQIISDPATRDILADEKIQKLIAALKENPNSAQRMLSELGPEYHSKIQRLIEAGLLGVSRR
eukprot:Seg1622.13 transcript_id=Seg1622.13/GoldUCD/mRNA.D3Y31 product="hypothetical protein" protein_id=Seg1622.13/GoldUCD/D3Y31